MTASGTVPQEEWESLMAVYQRRADLGTHCQAAARAADVARRYPLDRRLQLFCAQTAYYCAHRLKEHKEKREVALRGLEAARRVLDCDPKDYDGRFWWALTMFKSREAEGITAALREARRSKEFLETMIADAPDRFEAYMLLGVFYRELPPVVSFGDKHKALELLEKGASLAPNDPEMLLELAAAYRKVGRKDEARATFRKVIDSSVPTDNREWETQDARDYARSMLKKVFF